MWMSSGHCTETSLGHITNTGHGARLHEKYSTSKSYKQDEVQELDERSRLYLCIGIYSRMIVIPFKSLIPS